MRTRFIVIVAAVARQSALMPFKVTEAQARDTILEEMGAGIA